MKKGLAEEIPGIIFGRFNMNKVLKQVGSWILAFLIMAVIMNIALAFYNRSAGWIDRSTGATRAIFYPNTGILYSTEGRGYHKSDSRGYVNDVDVLADNYVIAVGASHSQGKEVGQGERYTDLLNKWLGYEDEAYVYNVSQSANYYPRIVKGFSALVQEFPDASKIVIEIGNTYYTADELTEALEQRDFDEKQTGAHIFSTLSTVKKISILAKQYSPLLFNINERYNELEKLSAENKSSGEEAEFDIDEYTNALAKTLELITSEYDGEIIVLYHPNVNIEKDGSMSIETAVTDDVFKAVCATYNVKVVDMSEKYLAEYEADYTVPCGFSNSKMGSGHINADGHRMIAEELLSVVSPEEN